MSTATMPKRRKPDVRRLRVLNCSDDAALEAYLSQFPQRSQDEIDADEDYQRCLRFPVATDEEIAFMEEAIARSRGKR